MAEKRNMVLNPVEKAEKEMNITFQNADTQISPLYTEAMNQCKAAFKAGQMDSLVKASEWLEAKQQEGNGATAADMRTYLLNEMNSITQSRDESPASGSASASASVAARCDEDDQDMDIDMESDADSMAPRIGSIHL